MRWNMLWLLATMVLTASSVWAQTSPYGVTAAGGTETRNGIEELYLSSQVHRLSDIGPLQAGPYAAVRVKNDVMRWGLGGTVVWRPITYLGLTGSLGLDKAGGIDLVGSYGVNLRLLQELDRIIPYVPIPPADFYIGSDGNMLLLGLSMGRGSSSQE
ncbi:MAG: hypothetical protein Q8Q20_03095 [bacterium]|nr:hypothetical protein [bacterium]